MADSLCGPSNASKTLLSHVERDRSLQQDRMVGGSNQGPSTFRSQLNRGNGADQAFAGFQQNGHMEPTLNGIPASVPGPAFHFPGQVPPGASLVGRPMVPNLAAHQATPAAHDWVNQFSSMNMGGQTTAPAPPMGVVAQPLPAAQLHGGQANMGFGFGQTGFAAPFGANYSGMPQMQMPGPSNMMYGAQNQGFAPVHHAESAIDVEAFNKAFGEFDDAEFDSEIANWAAKEVPAEQVNPVPVQPVQVEPEQQEEKLEENQTHRPRVDEELAQAANSILDSVAQNNSEKFQNSNFFQLMRRIGNKEVVVSGPNLVDIETGETVQAPPADGAAGEGDGNGKSAMGDEGLVLR